MPGLTSGPRRAAVAARSLELRRAIERTIRSGPGLAADAAALSSAYRSGAAPNDRHGHIHDRASAEAYAAARMPATFAAIAQTMIAIADRAPAFDPVTMLDIGAGTGASAWAATAVWPSLARLDLVDREPATIALGRRLAQALTAGPILATAGWRAATADSEPGPVPADLVTGTYVLGELGTGERPAVVDRLWAATRGVLLLVEPGSRAGFERIRAARAALIAGGGRVVAPCPGDEPCPIAGAAWCHFLARLDRSPLQRHAKRAGRSWEDEPFSYVAVSRTPADPAPRVVLGRPRQRPGVVELRVCVAGRIETRIVSRRQGPEWRAARDLAWGDPVPDDVPGGRGPDPRQNRRDP